MIDLTINKTGLEHNIQKAKENHIIIPTIAQMQNPDLIPEKIKAKLSHTGLWDVDPVNLFRISWHNEAKEQGGLFTTPSGPPPATTAAAAPSTPSCWPASPWPSCPRICPRSASTG